MNQLQCLLMKRESELMEILQRSEKYLETAPEGSLRVDCNNNAPQYYVRKCKQDTHGTYISKKDMKLVSALAQKEYEKKVLQTAHHELQKLKEFNKAYSEKKIQRIWANQSRYRKELIAPHEISDEEFAQTWEQEEYVHKTISVEDEDGIFTERGEQVRSKSEKILADKFYRLGIPYYYEKPLYLDGYGIIHPDFTLLNVCERKTFYWEHLGLMDKEEYCDSSIKKIERMQQNGIYQGSNLILTYETSTHPLNTRFVDGLIEAFLR